MVRQNVARDAEGRGIAIGDQVRNLIFREDKEVQRGFVRQSQHWLVMTDGTQWPAVKCILKQRVAQPA